MTERQLSCGRSFGCVNDVMEASNAAGAMDFDFISCCVSHPRCRYDVTNALAASRDTAVAGSGADEDASATGNQQDGSLPKKSVTGNVGGASDATAALPPIERVDLRMASSDWTRHIVGEVLAWVDVDSPDPSLRAISERVLMEEFQYANYLGLTVLVVPIRSARFNNLARLVNGFLQKNTFTSIWLQVPASLPSPSPDEETGSSRRKSGGGDGSSAEAGGGPSLATASVPETEDPWHWWNRFRGMCDGHKKLGLALEIPADLPDQVQALRWLGEPVRCLAIKTDVFLTNNKGCPVLSRAHQRFVHGFFKLETQVLLGGAVVHEGKAIRDYKMYLDWLWHQQPPMDAYSTFAKGYEDYLQVPLQPLSDHLESQIYETFERDPVKYAEYENAIERALKDKKAENTEDFVVTVMVLGAGRGPLVSATIRAAAKTAARVKVYAVEKNPNSLVTLRYLQANDWSDADVEVIHSDMRRWEPDVKADIVVSELLGSFGDNELSPECLDGAQRLLKGDAISIPQSYTSFVVPVQTQKLYGQIRDFVEKASNREEAYDNGYVVRVHNRFELGRPQPLFTFHHPNVARTSNTRHSELAFRAETDCVVHGIAGFFEATLYKDVRISINPETHSPGMFSWFPILFPLREPVNIRAGDTVRVNFWRLADTTQVWYEWCLSGPTATAVQNTNGKTYKMKLF